jgi:fatty acid-binding protein DegV
MEDLIKVIEDQNNYASGTFVPKSLTYLKNGGRVSAGGALIGNALKILPIVTFVNGHMDPALLQKSRTFERGKLKTIDTILSR